MSLTKDRINCVFCKKNLTCIYTIKNHLSFSPTESPEKDPIYLEIPIGICYICSSIQCMKLINPEILYKESHNQTSTTPTWKKHHDSFYHFCDSNISDKNNILEIGGSNCVLAKKFVEKYDIKYTILDFIKDEINHDNINFKIGNCEKYAFDNQIIIMSHVFEHLHDPQSFLENLSKSNVKKIIISVPALQNLLFENNINLINIEHTFYFTPVHLLNLFGNYSFECIEQISFMNHSTFFYFEKRINDYKPISYDNKQSILLENYFQIRETSFNNILIKESDINIWIVPSGHYGYILYQSLYKRNFHKNIKGFLDNDKIKQNKYMKSTALLIYPFERIISESNITVLLYGGPYTQEIKQQILSLNSNCSFIVF